MKLPLDGSPSARSMTLCDHRPIRRVSSWREEIPSLLKTLPKWHSKPSLGAAMAFRHAEYSVSKTGVVAATSLLP
jgi:hypothetical protein